MNDTELGVIAAWLTDQGLKGAKESAVLEGFCLRCREGGIPITRGTVLIDTLHPDFEGRAFQWDHQNRVTRAFEYGSSSAGSQADTWPRSAFYYLRENGLNEVRRKLGSGEIPDFYTLDELQKAGQTDYIAMIHRFAQDGSIGEMDCLYSNWTTENAEGFSDENLHSLRRLIPTLAIAVKCTSLARISRTIAEVYLGKDAARQVLDGRISRGTTEKIPAVLWFSDLRGYTSISDSSSPEEIIPLLNDYADAVISSIHEARGTVLKLMGDGILAIFRQSEPEEACASALLAEELLRQRLAELSEQRIQQKRPVTDVYLGLHIGDVFYGNIGSQDRLDFTVIGPAVNEASRMAAMCRSIDRNVVISSAFVEAAPVARRGDLVSAGRFVLRGVQRPQELFTLIGRDDGPVVACLIPQVKDM